MRVYNLRFSNLDTFRRAFQRVVDADRVGSCAADSDARRLRFLAPALLADSLVLRIYLDGGMTWCSRHDLLARR